MLASIGNALIACCDPASVDQRKNGAFSEKNIPYL